MLVLFVDVTLLRLEGSALADLDGLSPSEPTELTVLLALCGGMGTGPLGVRGSIALGFVTLDSTKDIKQQQHVRGKQTIHQTQVSLRLAAGTPSVYYLKLYDSYSSL